MYKFVTATSLIGLIYSWNIIITIVWWSLLNHVLAVLACSRALHVYVLACLVCLRVYVRACYDGIFFFLTCLRTCCAFLSYLLYISILKFKNSHSKKSRALLSWTYFLFTFWYQLKQYQFLQFIYSPITLIFVGLIAFVRSIVNQVINCSYF